MTTSTPAQPPKVERPVWVCDRCPVKYTETAIGQAGAPEHRCRATGSLRPLKRKRD